MTVNRKETKQLLMWLGILFPIIVILTLLLPPYLSFSLGLNSVYSSFTTSYD
jgi:hypothetical protein